MVHGKAEIALRWDGPHPTRPLPRPPLPLAAQSTRNSRPPAPVRAAGPARQKNLRIHRSPAVLSKRVLSSHAVKMVNRARTRTREETFCVPGASKVQLRNRRQQNPVIRVGCCISPVATYVAAALISKSGSGQRDDPLRKIARQAARKIARRRVLQGIAIDFGVVLLLALPAPVVLRAQDTAPSNPAPASTTTVSGVLRTTDGAAVPGATLRLTDVSSGRAWVSWTDESGHFSLPGMSPGHYRLEVAQLGFDPITKEVDVTPQGASPVDLVAKVASLQVIEQQSSQAVSEAAPSNASANPAASPAVPAESAPGSNASASSATSETSPPIPLRRRQEAVPIPTAGRADRVVRGVRAEARAAADIAADMAVPAAIIQARQANARQAGVYQVKVQQVKVQQARKLSLPRRLPAIGAQCPATGAPRRSRSGRSSRRQRSIRSRPGSDLRRFPDEWHRGSRRRCWPGRRRRPAARRP